MHELAVLGDGRHRGEVVVDGRADLAAELGLLAGVLLGNDDAVDVFPGGLALDIGDESDL